jgi:glucosamine 6-phosphate synthetase-like amidotransferase/phosphosugar isomerase protein
LAKHLQQIPEIILKTEQIQQTFEPLSYHQQTLWLVGSGSSYSQGYICLNYSAITCTGKWWWKIRILLSVIASPKRDVLVHIIQEAKRQDNYCPVNFAKKMGLYTLLFTSKQTDLSKQMDEVYWYVPEPEKLLVACTSFVAPYLVLLRWANVQLQASGLVPIPLDLPKILTKTEQNIKGQNWQFIKTNSSFLYTGYAKSIALEGALKTNECLLLDSENYELKHFSHGKHFVSYNQHRVFNALTHTTDQDLVDLYKESIFETHHLVNYTVSNFEPEIAIFDRLHKCWHTSTLQCKPA